MERNSKGKTENWKEDIERHEWREITGKESREREKEDFVPLAVVLLKELLFPGLHLLLLLHLLPEPHLHFMGELPYRDGKYKVTSGGKKKRWERKLINKWTKKKNSPNLSIFQLNGNRLYGEISFLLFPPSKAVVWWCYNISAPHCTNLLPAAPSSSVKRVWRTHY